jgi:hypothetical protein
MTLRQAPEKRAFATVLESLFWTSHWFAGLMVSNASAQVPEPNVSPWQEKRLTPPEDRERLKKLDDAYKAATKNIPDQKWYRETWARCCWLVKMASAINAMRRPSKWRLSVALPCIRLLSMRHSQPKGRASRAPKKPIVTISNNSIFVVHGRDVQLSTDMFAFLRSIGLNPLEWSQAIKDAKGANPHVDEVIYGAMQKVQGVLIMFSPDEEARLKTKLCSPLDKKKGLNKLDGQARPNVIFEAGLALGAHSKKAENDMIGKLDLEQRALAVAPEVSFRWTEQNTISALCCC